MEINLTSGADVRLVGPVGMAAVVCRATAHKCAVEVKRGVDRVVRVPLKFVDAIALVF